MREKIDLGFLNEKQVNKLIAEVAQSDVNWIAVHILKVGRQLSVALSFVSEADKERWDAGSEKLVKDLNILRR